MDKPLIDLPLISLLTIITRNHRISETDGSAFYFTAKLHLSTGGRELVGNLISEVDYARRMRAEVAGSDTTGIFDLAFRQVESLAQEKADESARREEATRSIRERGEIPTYADGLPPEVPQFLHMASEDGSEHVSLWRVRIDSIDAWSLIETTTLNVPIGLTLDE